MPNDKLEKVLTAVVHLTSEVSDIQKHMATKSDLLHFKSEILTSVDKVMKELQAHRLEDKSTFALYLELKERQDKRDKAFAKALGLDLDSLDGTK